VLGAVLGLPFDRRTWSGASAHLFEALRRRGALVGAVDADPPPWERTLAKVASVAPDRQRWRERYEYSPLVRHRSEALAVRTMARIHPTPDVLLQIGAYYDFSRHDEVRPRLRASFHDANLALFARSGVFVQDADAGHVRAMMRHEQRVLDRLDLIMPMSRWLADSFVEDFHQDPGKVVVVGTGVNIRALPAEVPDRDWSVPRLLFIGFDWQRKGLPLAIEAWRLLRGRHPEATLTVVGPEPQGPEEPGLRWIGRVDRSTPDGDARTEALHREATVFVLLPSYDPMPNVVLEAMAHGLPVVVPDTGSMPEMVPDGVAGTLLADRTPETVASALETLFAEPGRAQAYGAAGRQRVAEKFTWDAVVGRMMAAMGERLPRR
jgi:glycosyltransferase involved in cell wall biosynthesis